MEKKIKVRHGTTYEGYLIDILFDQERQESVGIVIDTEGKIRQPLLYHLTVIDPDYIPASKEDKELS